MQDYEEILSELEEVVATSKKSVFSNTVSVNPEEIFAIVDRLRENMPTIIREASFIRNDMERQNKENLRRAQEMIETAKARAEKMTNEQAVIKDAERRAESMIREAAEYKARVTKGMTDGLIALLNDTRDSLLHNLKEIDGQIRVLRESLYSDEFDGK